jgi:hypothetical protein
MTTDQAKPPSPVAPVRRRWGRRGAVLAAALLALLLGHRPLLRLAAGALVAEDSAEGVLWVVPFDADRLADDAAGRCRRAPATRVLLIERPPDRTQRLGVRASWAEELHSALRSRGVPESAVDVLPGGPRSDWDVARALRTWLAGHPGAAVAAVCDRFGSRRLRTVLDQVLGPDAPRVRVVALPDRRYDESNWWRSKDGVVGFWGGVTGLAYAALVGEGDSPDPDWDADAYERALSHE